MKSETPYEPIEISAIHALHDHVLVRDMKFEERTSSGGIVLVSDNMKSAGICPRWAQVYAVGPKQYEVKPGEWVLVEHGRWTRGHKVKLTDSGEVITMRRIDPQSILAVSDVEHADDTMSDKVL